MNRDRGKRTREKTVLDLPQELIIQILLRLPVKSLIRFKCVCKSWLSLISDSHFALSHYDLAPARKCRLVLFAPSASKFRSMDVDASLLDDSVSTKLNVDFLHPQSCYKVKIMGSCRGFILLECYPNLYMWNPSTGVYKRISLSVNALYFPFLYGFGYDSSTDDYLVVLATCDSNTADYASRVELYSLRGNNWEEIEDTPLSYVVNSPVDSRVGSLLNGAIHWLAFRRDVLPTTVIVAFDLIERSFSEILVPVDFDDNYCFCELRVLGGFLSLYVEGCGDHQTEIWVMEQYKVQSSWTMTMVLSVDDIPALYFSLICSTKCGDTVGRDGGTGLVKCDDTGHIKEHRSYCDDPLGFQVDVYTESLLSLPGDDCKQAS